MVATEQPELGVGYRRALRGDGGSEADMPAAQGVELAFHHDERPPFAYVRPGAVEVKQEVSLGKDRRLRRVDVFGLPGGIVGGRELRLSRGEGHDASLVIPDGDHEPAAKAVPERAQHERAALPRGEEQPALPQGILGKLPLDQHVGESAPPLQETTPA